jgi:hypothetical protein
MLEPPELVSVSGRDWVLPVETLPKLRLGAVAESDPAVVAVPETATVRLGFDASLLTERLKLAAPADLGAKVMLKGTDWPPAKVFGRTRSVVYPAPPKLACVTVTLEPPELLNVPGKAWVLPVCTDPKLKLDGVTVSAPAVTAVTVRGIVTVGVAASEVTVRFPLRFPAA